MSPSKQAHDCTRLGGTTLIEGTGKTEESREIQMMPLMPGKAPSIPPVP